MEKQVKEQVETREGTAAKSSTKIMPENIGYPWTTDTFPGTSGFAARKNLMVFTTAIAHY